MKRALSQRFTTTTGLVAAGLVMALGLTASGQEPRATQQPVVTYLQKDVVLLNSAEKILYKKTPQEDMHLYLLRPAVATKQPLPAIVCFTGGGWVDGLPTGMINNAAWYRDQGIIGITADYRVKSRHKTSPMECVMDAKSAIRYVRAHAAKLGIDPNRIIAAGGSAGGHIAAATVLDGHDEPGEDLTVSARPDGLELHNPVLGLDFGAWWFAQNPSGSPILGVKKGWPPTILSNGTKDNITSIGNAQKFTKAMQDAGNVCELITIPEAGHSCDWPATNPHFLPTMLRMRDFWRENGILPAPAK